MPQELDLEFVKTFGTALLIGALVIAQAQAQAVRFGVSEALGQLLATIIVRELGMMNSYWGLIVPVMITPFGVFWMRQFIMTIPNDYAEAARIDGLSEFQIFWRIIFPMCKPALGALAILTFMSNWNSLIWPLIVAAKRDLWTIPVGLISFQSEYHKPLNLIFAMAVVSVLPTIILFALVRRRLLEGIGTAGIKG